MKRLLLVSWIVIFVIGNAFADQASKVSKESRYVKSNQSKFLKPTRRNDGYEAANPNGTVYIAKKPSTVNLPGTKVGETAYNYQTNDNLHDRICYDKASGKIHVQWMYGDISETAISFPGRRMYYNFYDGSSWSYGLGIPIENQRTGYGSLAVDPNDIAVTTSHFTTTNSEACDVWYDFMEGFGFFSMTHVWETRKHGTFYLEPFWPDIAVDDQDVWYVTATNNNQDDFVELVNGVNDNIIFWRSTNRGQTWSDWLAMFPDTTTYHLTEGASGTNEAGSHQVAVSDIGDGKVGILVGEPAYDFHFFESLDRGINWKPAVQIIGNTFMDVNDSLSSPMIWDIVIIDSSSFGGTIDTILYPFYRDSDTDAPVPNIRPRPNGSADLLYVNGEAHVVWNEMTRTSENSSYPNGYSYWWTNPAYHFLNGDTVRQDAGFAIKHWSPSTGVSNIFSDNRSHDVWPGTFQQYVSMPQIGVGDDGSLYCLFTKYSDTDTLLASDGVKQAETNFGPLSFGRIWGAKSTDGGKTWFDAGELIPEQDCIHQNIRYIAVADQNNKNTVRILYQNTPNLPGTAIGGTNVDHSSFATANMMYWGVPTSLFPTTKTPLGPELELITSSKFGGLDFGDIGTSGSATKSFTVKNVGDQDLVVSGIFASHKSFIASPVSFTVAPNSSQVVEVTFKPVTADTFSWDDTFLAIPNNDVTEASAGIPLEGYGLPTGVTTDRSNTIAEYSLSQNYPNPFNPTTQIKFNLKNSSVVKLVVYNMMGEEIAVLINRKMDAGFHLINWNASSYASGVYFYRLVADDFNEMKKMVLMK
jgi:hypothetical protein